MTDQSKGTSGPNSDTSGSEDDSDERSGKGSVSYDTYDKTRKSERNLKKILAEAQSKLDAFEREKQDIEDRKAMDDKKYVDVIEKLKGENSNLMSELGSLKKSQINGKKISAAVSLFEEKGVKIEAKYHALIPIDQIEMSDNGEIDRRSLDDVVRQFQKDHPRILVTGKGNSLPSHKTSDNAGKMSIEEWKDLPYAEKKKAWKEGRVAKS